jgi:glycerate 2-kinase
VSVTTCPILTYLFFIAVLGDPLDLIASGPTVPDTSTREDAWEIVERYQLSDKLPYDVVAMLQDPALPDSPSPDHPVFFNAQTVLVGNNALAVSAAAKEAERLGYHPVVLGTQIEGEAKEIAKMYTRMALHLKEQTGGYNVAPSLPVALIAGGETTVSLSPNSGKGGRNQELALSAALQLESLKLAGVVLASAGTDGTDGPTDAAGAVVDASTVSADVSSARQALLNHDAYTYFDKHGSKDGDGPLIKTGPTGTNVADICVTLIR